MQIGLMKWSCRLLVLLSATALAESQLSPIVPLSQPIWGSGDEGDDPSVASNGTVAFVAWTDRGGNIRGTRVDANETVLDHQVIFGRGSKPAVVFDGTNFVLIWQAEPGDGGGAGDVVAIHIAPDGQVLDNSPLDLTGFYGTQVTPCAIGGSAESFLMGWGSSYYAFSPDAGATGYAPPGGPCGGASDGTRYFMVTSDLFGRFIGFDGVPAGSSFDVGSMAGQPGQPSVAWNGVEYLVAWSAHQGNWSTFAARVSANGSVLDVPPLVLDAYGGGRTPAVMTRGDGGDFTVVFPRQIFTGLAHVSSSGAFDVDGGPPLFNEATTQLGAAMVEGRPLTVYSASRIKGLSLDRPIGVPYTVSVAADWQSAIEMHPFEGGDLVGWYDRGDFDAGYRFTRLDADGGVLDPLGFELGVPAGRFAFTSAGQTHLIAWVSPPMASPRFVNVANFEVDAGVLLMGPVTTLAATGGFDIAVESNGVDALVAWDDGTEIVGQRVSLNAQPIDAIAQSLLTGLNGIQETVGAHLSLAASGGEYYVVDAFRMNLMLADGGPAYGDGGVYFPVDSVASGAGSVIAVSPTGTGIDVFWLDDAGVATSTTSLPNDLMASTDKPPTAAFDGNQFFVTWCSYGELRGAYLAVDGGVVGDGGFVMIANGQPCWSSGVRYLVSPQQGRSFLIYQDYVPGQGASRLALQYFPYVAPPLDAGNDAGSATSDGGKDAGAVVDSGVEFDAGSGSDGGVGSNPDGGVAPPLPMKGCGCEAGSGFTVLALLSIVRILRRRR